MSACRLDFALRLGSAVVVALVLAGAAMAPERAIPSFYPQQDKLEHMLAFAALSFLVFWSAPVALGRSALLLLFAFGLEWAQSWTSYREASLLDAASSSVGVLMGWSGACVVALLHTIRASARLAL
jgi:VanZ family protein